MNQFSKLITLLVLFAAGFVLGGMSDAAAQTKESRTRNATTWEERDDGRRARVRIEGKVEFTDDYTDVRNLSEDSSLLAEEETGGTARRFELTRMPDGQLRRSYYFNGRSREFDADGRAWLARILKEAVRQGIDAEGRSRRILDQKGARAALDEIALVKGDHTKRVYFETVIKGAGVDDATLRGALSQAARQIESDYEKAQLLINVADTLAGRNVLLPAFFDAAEGIKSDYERRRVLASLVKKTNLNRDTLLRLLKTSETISSDYEKANFLIQASTLYVNDARLRSAFFTTVQTINSEHERGRVLSTMLKRNQIN